MSGFSENVEVLDAAGLNNGDILVAGSFTSYGGASRNNIVMVNPDGSVDTAFDPGSGANGTVRKVYAREDGGFVLTGDFTHYDGVPADGIIRIAPDGKATATQNFSQSELSVTQIQDAD